MKRNYTLKLNFFDIFISIFMVLALIATIITTNILYKGNISSNNAHVQIHLDDKIIKDIKVSELSGEVKVVLSKDIYKDSSLIGNMTILINKDKGICVSEVDCPNHTCQKQGWVNRVGIPVTCVPNNVFVIIVTDSKEDPDIVLGG